jgi:hypothetical protein
MQMLWCEGKGMYFLLIILQSIVVMIIVEGAIWWFSKSELPENKRRWAFTMTISIAMMVIAGISVFAI